MNLKQERANLIEKLKNPSQKEIDEKTYSFALFSANIKKFLPLIDKSEYKKLFERFLYFKWSSGLEQYSMEYLNSTKVINNSTIDLTVLNQDNPLIFSSFHFGSFRLFNSILFELGHKIVIIIDDTIVKQQKDDLLFKVKPLLKVKESSDFIILSVQDRTSIFKLKQLISEGYIMTVYLDGNTGVNTKSQDFNKGFMPINFLGQQIYVKNGISKLAALLGAKIVPVISYRDKDEKSIVEFCDVLSAEQYSSRQDFITKSIQDSYKVLENKIIEFPTQWTSWLTIQNLFLRDYSTPFDKNYVPKNKFNDDRYTLFVVNNSCFLFDLFDYQS